MPETPEAANDLDSARRAVLRGAAVAAAAAVPLLASASAAEAKPKPKGKKPKGKPVGSTKDVPVGSGKVFTKDKVIVTQPKKGKFNAFNAICTHANCVVSGMQKGKMICPCHNAEFDLDGKPIKGVARRPLNPEKITVVGDKIYKA